MLYNLLKNKGLVILLAGFILFALGCSTSPRKDSTMFLRSTDLVNTYYYLERDKTTMDDVFKRLGEPEVRAKDQLGRDLWIYRNYEISPELILRVISVQMFHRINSIGYRIAGHHICNLIL